MKILRWLGYTRCRVCNKWTQPSIVYGDICSFKCLKKDLGLNQKEKK